MSTSASHCETTTITPKAVSTPPPHPLPLWPIVHCRSTRAPKRLAGLKLSSPTPRMPSTRWKLLLSSTKKFSKSLISASWWHPSILKSLLLQSQQMALIQAPTWGDPSPYPAALGYQTWASSRSKTLACAFLWGALDQQADVVYSRM